MPRPHNITMTNINAAYVLYVDHQGHPAPLSLSYHATASRRLASAINRHPPSTVTEVDSAFCPQCLAFHDANTAANIGYCPKPTCRLCPTCQAVASIDLDEDVCFYKCGLCDWTSRECNLSVPVTVGDDGALLKEELAKAAGELGRLFTERQQQIDHSTEAHYKTMLQALEGFAKEQVKGKRTNPFYSLSAAAARRGNDGPQGWSVQTLEESMDSRKELVAASISEVVGGQDLNYVSLEVEQSLQESLETQPSKSIFLQGGTITSLSDLLPLEIPLRPRKSRRCRAELAEGRPGILVKPKLNPLEGDSSLRTGHGQWWKKDSSAIHVMPQVRVVRHGSDGAKHAVLLKVTNPTLGAVHLRLQSSAYSGEPVWENKSMHNPLLEDLLVDPLTEKKINAKLMTESSSALQATEMCELDPAEDSFLELGKSSFEEPEGVANWTADAALSDSAAPTLRLVTQKSAAAWFELVVIENQLDEEMYAAIPLALQIKVGDGSWESSLIQPETGEIYDMVTFDLVIAWNNSQ